MGGHAWLHSNSQRRAVDVYTAELETYFEIAFHNLRHHRDWNASRRFRHVFRHALTHVRLRRDRD